MREYFKLMRVKHYMKNLLIFLPAVLTRKLFEVWVIKEVVIGVVIFSFVSSVIYIINDIRDVEMDRLHPVKSKRPLASGKVSLRAAKMMVIFLTAAVICIWGYKRFAFEYMLIPLLYLVLNVAYSLKLKEYPLIDVFILMLGICPKADIWRTVGRYRIIRMDVSYNYGGSIFSGIWEETE